MGKGDHLGEFEQHVMHAVVGLGINAYGVTIRRIIEEKAHRRVSFGSVYAALERLERKRLVHSWMGESTPERGGRAKRYYELTAHGQHVLEASHDAYMNMRTLIGKPAWGRS